MAGVVNLPVGFIGQFWVMIHLQLTSYKFTYFPYYSNWVNYGITPLMKMEFHFMVVCCFSSCFDCCWLYSSFWTRGVVTNTDTWWLNWEFHLPVRWLCFWWSYHDWCHGSVLRMTSASAHLDLGPVCGHVHPNWVQAFQCKIINLSVRWELGLHPKEEWYK